LDYVRMDTLAAAGTTARHLGFTADSSNVVYLVEWQFHMNALGPSPTAQRE